MKVNNTTDDNRINSILKIIQTSKFTEKSFFYTILGYTQSQSYPLDGIDGFYQFIAGLYKSNKPIKITGIDKIHLKCDCIQGSIVYENLFCIVLLCLLLQVMKYIKNHE